MQTFLPYPHFKQSAACLDYKRLGKQRVEAKQILSILLNLTPSKAWTNHPATKMWRGYEASLACYGKTICLEWINRGYKDTLLPFFEQYAENNSPMPPWFGSKEFHDAHKSNLIRKDFEYYSKYNWDVPEDLSYLW